MKIKKGDSSSEQYAIISYSHADREAVESELKVFDKNGVCYWIDDNMKMGTTEYDKQFQEMLDNKNCKGIIFFGSDEFLLSEPCFKEMEYFKEKYKKEGRSDKFCLFILPPGYPYNNFDSVKERVVKYAKDSGDIEKIDKLTDLKDHVKSFLKLNGDGKILHGTIGNVNNYVEKNCEEGQVFHQYGIISGFTEITYQSFGYFPQLKSKKIGASSIENESKPRKLDGAIAYYAPIEWLVIKDNEKEQILLSKELLMSIDYLSLKYPFNKKPDETIKQYIKDKFLKKFKGYEDNCSQRIKSVRFLKADELQKLLNCCQEDMEKKREVLLPEPTYFAQITNRKNSYAFWLAGDTEDARRVDSGTERLSDQKAGVELYYVRVVIEVEKVGV
jgi:hypothetical protein